MRTFIERLREFWCDLSVDNQAVAIVVLVCVFGVFAGVAVHVAILAVKGHLITALGIGCGSLLVIRLSLIGVIPAKVEEEDRNYWR